MRHNKSSMWTNNVIYRHVLILFFFQFVLLQSSFQHRGIVVSAAEDASNENDGKNGIGDEKLEWGTFYDPKGLFCGDFDCYKILGFDYLTFDKVKPTMKEITKSYRSLSRRYHPDKNKGSKSAKEKFVKIARAYEVLTNSDKRKEYDYLRDRPDEYLHKYGSSVIFKYAPKSDVRIIIIILLVSASLFTWFVQKQRWRTVADHLIKAAVEDWGRREGGSTESAEIRQKALDILADQQEQKEQENGHANNGSAAGKKPPKKGAKVTKKEKKQEEKEALRKIVEKLVNEIDDFGGGFRKPTWKDVFVVKCLYLPAAIFRTVSWGIIFYARRLRGLPYSDEELEVMTKRAVGQIAWDACSEEEHEQMKKSALWNTQNLEEWKEMQEMKTLSAGERKQITRLKKKSGSKLE